MIVAWRIVKKRYVAHAFSGEGARLYGGRWNSPGVALVYVASSRPLAVLETAVHLERSALLTSFVLIPCEFPESLVEVVAVRSLPPHWRREPPLPELAMLGDAWCRASRTAVLEIPSVIIEQDKNYLLNPGHPEFRHLRIGEPQDFTFDDRLLT